MLLDWGFDLWYQPDLPTSGGWRLNSVMWTVIPSVMPTQWNPNKNSQHQNLRNLPGWFLIDVLGVWCTWMPWGECMEVLHSGPAQSQFYLSLHCLVLMYILDNKTIVKYSFFQSSANYSIAWGAWREEGDVGTLWICSQLVRCVKKRMSPAGIEIPVYFILFALKLLRKIQG